MRNIFKKAFFVIALMTLMMVALCFTGSALTSGYYTYTVSDGSATINSVNTAISGDVTIPAKLGGCPVTAIGEDAFNCCEGIQSLIIPDSVTNIDAYAFYGCRGLQSVSIPDSVTTLGNYAFYSCESLQSITIPDSVTSMGKYIFGYCKKLSDIEFPEGITSIAIGTFSGCEGLKNIEIPDSVTTIGDSAFADCCLVDIEIPDSVTCLGKNVFLDCDSLTSIIIPDSITSISENAFYDCFKLSSVEIPDSVTSIGEDAFFNCDSLKSIVIPQSVTSIGEMAFGWCDGLTSIKIPASVTSISNRLFEFCANLTDVEISDGITSIGSSAFYQCKSLESIEIPDSVKSIGYRAFDSCSALKSIVIRNPKCNIYDERYTIPATATVYGYKNSTAQVYAKKYSKTFVELVCVHINSDWIIDNEPTCKEDGLKHIECTLCRETIETSTIEKISHNYTSEITEQATCTETGLKVFNCSCSDSYTEVIPAFGHADSDSNELCDMCNENVEETGKCGDNVTYKRYTDGTVVISGTGDMEDYGYGKSPFCSKDSVKSVIINEGVTSIGNNMFSNCFELSQLKVASTVTHIGDSAFSCCTSLSNIDISDGVESIGSKAFEMCQLFGIHIPKSVASIAYDAFDLCWSLEAIGVDENNPYYCNDSFGVLYDKNMETLIKAPTYIYSSMYNECDMYIIPDGVVTVGKNAFYPCVSLVSIVIPKSVTLIDSNAIDYCENLENVFYFGNETERSNMTIERFNSSLTSALWQYNYCFHTNQSEHLQQNPTCTQSGYTAGVYCTDCNTWIEGHTEIPALSHKWNDGVINSVSTCKTQGSITYTCLNDPAHRCTEKLDLDKNNHEGGTYLKDQKDATCNVNGYTGDTYCSGCNDKLESGVATGFISHTPSTAVTENRVEPKCTAKGSYDEVVYCSVCDTELSRTEREIPALTHKWNDGVIDPVSTCKTHGIKTYTCLNDESHQYTEQVALDSNNHDGGSYLKNVAAATCIADGYTGDTYCSGCDVKLGSGEVIEALTHKMCDWAENSDGTHSRNCQRDNCEYTQTESCTYCEWITTKSATCTQEGSESKSCTVCSYTITKAIPTTPHTPASAVTENRVEPKCETKGSFDEVVYCSDCDTELSRTEKEISATNHINKTTYEQQSPTCTTNGYTAGVYCPDCKQWLEGHEEIEVTGHTYTSEITTEPTHLQPGVKTFTCECGDTYTEPVAKLEDHTYTSKVTKAATCTKSGTKTYTCSCGDTYTESITKLSHKYSSTYTTYKKATCTTEGSKSKHCTRSGCTVKTSVTAIVKKAHTYKTTTTKATLTKNGKVVSKCSVCGATKTTTVYYPKTIKLSATKYTYNGKVQTPSVTVKDTKGNTLKKDTDYTVKYSSGRKAIGKYTVTITFKGKYTGSKKLTYTIVPKTTSKVTASQTTTSVTLKWSKVTGATGYRIYQKVDGKWKTLTNTTKLTYTVKKLKAGTKYTFAVRPYTVVGKETILAATYTQLNTATKTATPTLKVSSSKKGIATLSWTNVAGETGYEVYYSTKKDSGFKKLTTTKSNVAKASKSKLTSKKTYYFKVRAYKTVDGTKIYSTWSTVKSVKVK